MNVQVHVVERRRALELSVALVVDPGAPVDDHGDANIIVSFARMRWLDSDVGIDEETTYPFAPVRALIVTDESLRVACTGKELVVGANGLPACYVTDPRPARRIRTEPGLLSLSCE